MDLQETLRSLQSGINGSLKVSQSEYLLIASEGMYFMETWIRAWFSLLTVNEWVPVVGTRQIHA